MKPILKPRTIESDSTNNIKMRHEHERSECYEPHNTGIRLLEISVLQIYFFELARITIII